MSTWRIGDSWITVSGLTMGVGAGKELSQQEATERRKARKAATGDDVLRPDRVTWREVKR
jgi:hypothetical protein